MTAQGRLHFASPPSFEGGQTTYEVTVVATDEGALTGTFDVTVTVTDVEEEGAVTITPLRGWTDTQFSATLTDGDDPVSSETWQWARSTNRSSWTDISGETSSAYTATADDVSNYLRVSTEYTDGRGSGKTVEAVLTTRIADVADKPTTNETPDFADTSATPSIGQGTAPRRSIGAAVRATDEDRDDVLIYSLSGTDADSFDIDPRTGQLRTKAVLLHDPQGQNTYTVTVEVHDGFDGSYSPSTASDATIDVTITVTAAPTVVRPPPPRNGGGGGGGGAPANRPPEFSEGSTTGRSIPENTPAGVTIGGPLTATDRDRDDTLTYSLRGVDAAAFDIDPATGQLLTKAPLDHESLAAYSLIVAVHDGKSPTGSDSDRNDNFITVAIDVENADEPGSVALSSTEPQVDVALTAVLTDPDGGLARVAWRWERSADQTAWAAIDGAESDVYTPAIGDWGSYLRVTASYDDGHGRGKSAEALTAESVPGLAFPVAPSGGLERSVAENAGAGEAVGSPVTAMHPDGGALTYALSGPDAASFTIDERTGQIRVGAGTAMDYEADKNVYAVTVTAADSSGASAAVAVTISVTDVPLPGRANDYDADNNEAIDRDEAIAAVADYFRGVIGREQTIAIISLYFAG